MIYPIVIYGSQTLRNPSENIAPDYPDLEKLVEDMFLTLGEADGVGLAAPQIGKNIRLFVVDCTPWGEDHPELADYRRAFINAEIYERSEETSLFNEGCLSLPGLHEDVRRPVSIRMRYVDEKFVEHDEEFTGLLFIQDEINTLERETAENSETVSLRAERSERRRCPVRIQAEISSDIGFFLSSADAS